MAVAHSNRPVTLGLACILIVGLVSKVPQSPNTIQRLQIEQAPDGPAIVGLFGSAQEPQRVVPDANQCK